LTYNSSDKHFEHIAQPSKRNYIIDLNIIGLFICYFVRMFYINENTIVLNRVFDLFLITIKFVLKIY